MKFNRRDIYCYIAHFKCCAALLFVYVFYLRWLKKNKPEKTVMMYSHILSGNTKAFFDYTLENPDLPYETYYTTIDKREYKKLHKSYGEKILLATKPSVLKRIFNAGIVMTSHGPGIFYLLKWLSPKVKFVDVWHGLGFKHFPKSSFDKMRFYQKVFASSEHFKNIYVNRLGFKEEQVVVTGYARVDKFENYQRIAKDVRCELGFGESKQIILFAPTYRPYGEDGEIPFGLGIEEFLEKLNEFAKKIDATFVFRAHMHSTLNNIDTNFENIRLVSQKQYPQTNNLLTASELVITDWSSIATDFWVLKRPVIFYCKEMPSTHRIRVPDIERQGDTVESIEELFSSIKKNLKQSKEEVEASLSDIIEKCYGTTLDGCSAKRYDEEIRRLFLM